jgi:hypothetical protein
MCAFLVVAFFTVALAAEPQGKVAKQEIFSCTGNIETFDKKLLQPGVQYSLLLNWDSKPPTVTVAGRSLKIEPSYNANMFKGPWFWNVIGKSYLSFLPDDGGILKLELESDVWYSGSCIRQRQN